MKINRFNKITEENSNTNKYHIFVITSAFENYPKTYLFDDYVQAFTFIRNRLYNLFKNDELQLDSFDDIDNIEDLMTEYEEYTVNVNIFYSNTDIINDVELDNWINMRKDLKNYNI